MPSVPALVDQVRARLVTGVSDDVRDLPALQAVVYLGERSGARGFEIGFDDDQDPVTWWASVTYRGAKLAVDSYPHPEAAADALALRILTGGQCTYCGRPIAVVEIADDRCRWGRNGDRWVKGCPGPMTEKGGRHQPQPPNPHKVGEPGAGRVPRAERRRRARGR